MADKQPTLTAAELREIARIADLEAEVERLKAELAKANSPVGWGDHLK